MPTPPQSYSAAAAEKLRRALLALAASAATLTAHAQDAEGDLVETVTLGEIPEDVIVDGEYMCTPCPKESCLSEDCFCEDACVEGKPCTNCDMPSSQEEKTHAENAESAEAKSHAETTEMVTVATIVSGLYPIKPAATNAPAPCRADDVEVVVRRHAEGAESQSHAENAEGAGAKTHAENAESAEAKTHAESAECAESGEGSGEAESSPYVAPAAATNAVQELARAMSEKSGYPVSADLVVAAAKRLNQDPEEYAKKTLEQIGGAAASTNAPSSAPSDRILVLGRRR